MLTPEKRELMLKLSTALIMDAVCTLKLPERIISKGIRPVVPFSRMVGTAVTVGMISQPDPEKANLDIYRQAFQPSGSICSPIMVIEVPAEHHNRGIFGEGSATMAMRNGFVGALIDGAVRDTHDIKRLSFPVFSRAIAPGYIVYKVDAVHSDKPVCIDGVTVESGHIIFGDNDGVVVIDPSELDAIVLRAQEIQGWEEKVLPLFAEGYSSEEIVKRVGPMPST